MQFKPFFVHVNNPRFREDNAKLRSFPRGFTAFVRPDPEEQRNILVAVTFCAYKDDFCKKEGRKYAMEAKAVSMNARELPDFLANQQVLCNIGALYRMSPYAGNFQYLYKYLF